LRKSLQAGHSGTPTQESSRDRGILRRRRSGSAPARLGAIGFVGTAGNREADFIGAGLRLEGIGPVREAMNASLDQLNEIRAELWMTAIAGGGLTAHGDYL